jgi:hypothetical protein
MPDWLITHLSEGGQVKAEGILQVIEQLLEQSSLTKHAYLCHPAVSHVSKLKKEGKWIELLVAWLRTSLLSKSTLTQFSSGPDPLTRRFTGGFCGYRNIQMLMSYIIGTQAEGAHHFEGNKLPSVFQIQDMIEDAWDKGINSHARYDTGGVRMTRKYIGTCEAQAVFCGLGIPYAASLTRPPLPFRPSHSTRYR